jgi:hypothetical protein
MLPPGSLLRPYGRPGGDSGPPLLFGDDVVTRAAYGDLFCRIGGGRARPSL